MCSQRYKGDVQEFNIPHASTYISSAAFASTVPIVIPTNIGAPTTKDSENSVQSQFVSQSENVQDVPDDKMPTVSTSKPSG